MQNIAKTKTSKFFTERTSVHWEFEQFELNLFEGTLLKYDHKFIKYFIYQKQERDGFHFIHGLIKFDKPLPYACVHLLIGKGKHCNINPTNIPLFIQQQCNLSQYDQATESGLLEDLSNPGTAKLVPNLNFNSKTSNSSTRPNVDVSFAEFLTKQNSLSEEDKLLIPKLYPYHNQ